MCITYIERQIKQRPGNHKKQQRNYSEYDITGPTVLQKFYGDFVSNKRQCTTIANSVHKDLER
jgi:hypothetical protein